MPARRAKSTTSGLLSADTAVLARPGLLKGTLILNTAATESTLTIYDNASAASGTVLFKGILATTQASIFFDLGSINVSADNGLYADIDGVGADFLVYYS